MMTKLIGPLMLLLLIISCGRKKHSDKQVIDNYTKANIELTSMEDNLESESKSISGEYISSNYIDNINKTKSVYSSRKFDNQSLFGFALDTKNLTSSNPILNGWLVHEGGYDKPLLYDIIKKKFIYDLSKLNNYETKQDAFIINRLQNNLELFFPLKNKRELYKKLNFDMQTELRKILFDGIYLDSSQNKNIIFKQDGTVINYKDYVYYEIIYDFSLAIEFDAIIFFKTKRGGNWNDGDIYKFKINNNSINLNFVETNWETMEHRLASKMTTLKKQNSQ